MKYIYDPNEKVNFTTMYGAEELFSPEECDRVKSIGDALTTDEAKTFGGGGSRKGKVSWLPQNNSTNFIYKKIFDLAKKANDENWKFNLTGLLEDCQYTTYESQKDGKYGDFYGCHLDIDGPTATQRKISIVVQLTDPTEYEGGDLEIYTWDKPFYPCKKQGSCILFPSFLLHKVTPVTKGKRNSLVLWVSGPPFK